MNKKIILIALLSVIVTGCTIGKSTKQSAQNAANQSPIAGTFKSTDSGETWSPKVSLFTADGTRKTLGAVNIRTMKYDPLDPNTIYLATDTGVYYSYNRGEGWFQTLSAKGIVNDIAIDPRDSCTLYAAVHSEVHKSENCGRSWTKIHYSTIPDEFYNTIIVSGADSNNVMLATSKGKLERSLNAGRSWDLLTIFKAPIVRFIGDSRNKNTFYIVQTNDIQKTEDNSATFRSLLAIPVHNADNSPQLDKQQKPVPLSRLPGANTFYDLKIDGSQTQGLIYASGYGIFRLMDEGYWREIGTLIKPREQTIYSVDINARNGQDIYFTTINGLYRSVNGGQDWAVRNLPSTGFPRFLNLATDAEHELVLGFTAPPQKK